MQLPLVALLVLASVALVSGGYYGETEEAYKNLKVSIVSNINTEVLQKGKSHAVKVEAGQAVEWDTAQGKAVPRGKTFSKSTIEDGCMILAKQECKEAITEILRMAENGKSASASGKGIYTSCADLKTAVGPEKPVANC